MTATKPSFCPPLFPEVTLKGAPSWLIGRFVPKNVAIVTYLQVLSCLHPLATVWQAGASDVELDEDPGGFCAQYG